MTDNSIRISIEKLTKEEQSLQNIYLLEGKAYFKKGEYLKASESYSQALEKFDKENTYDAAELYRNLASSLMMQGFYSKAEPYFIRSLEISELLLKNRPCYRHSVLLTRAVGALGTFFLNQSLIQEAEPYCIKCLSLAENTYGMDHYKLLEPIRAMSFLCEKQGNRYIFIFNKLKEKYIPINKYIHIYIYLIGKIEDGIKNLKRAYIIVVYWRGPIHEEAQKLINDLLRLLYTTGDFRMAEAYALLSLGNIHIIL